MKVCGKKESNTDKVPVMQHNGVRETTGTYSAQGNNVQVPLRRARLVLWRRSVSGGC